MQVEGFSGEAEASQSVGMQHISSDTLGNTAMVGLYSGMP